MSGAGPLHFGPVRRSDNAEFVFLLAELITSVLLIVAVTKEPCVGSRLWMHNARAVMMGPINRHKNI